MVMTWQLIIGLLTPYFSKGGEEIAKKIGGSLFDSLKKRFVDDKDEQGKKALENFKGDPEIYQGALEKVLERRLEDAGFKAWLEKEITTVQNTIGSVEQTTNTYNLNVEQKAEGNAHVWEMTGIVIGNKSDKHQASQLPHMAKKKANLASKKQDESGTPAGDVYHIDGECQEDCVNGI